jgi:hypothetical protein|nr:MAG TPA: hypothetical protein [Caudoviricetes sp.]
MNGLDLDKFKKFLFDMYNDMEIEVTPANRLEIDKLIKKTYAFTINENKLIEFNFELLCRDQCILRLNLTPLTNFYDGSMEILLRSIRDKFLMELMKAEKEGEASTDYINEFIDKLLGIATFKSVETHSWTTKNYRFDVYVNKENLSLSISDINCGGRLLSQDIPDYDGFPCRESVVKDIENFFLFFFSNHSTSYTKDRNELIDNLKERYGLDFSYEREEY